MNIFLELCPAVRFIFLLVLDTLLRKTRTDVKRMPLPSGLKKNRNIAVPVYIFKNLLICFCHSQLDWN